MPFGDALAGAGTAKLLERLLQRLEKMDRSIQAMANEWAQRRRLGLEDVVSDDYRVITVGTQGEEILDLVQDHGRPGASLTVLAAEAGSASLSYNGGTQIDVKEGDSWDRIRVYQLRIVNDSTTDELKVHVGLVSSKALGAGAWA